MFGTQQLAPQGDRHPHLGSHTSLLVDGYDHPAQDDRGLLCVLRSSFFWPPGCVQTHCDLTDTRTQGAAHFGAVSFDCRLTVV